MTNIIKFLTAGNVDDGKSTLIGRLLYDTNSLFQDQISEVEALSEGGIDYSLFLDGLSSERSQKITIDVAYRYFSYQGKKIIIADAPGHKQYTKNMAVAAANSDIVIILIDAIKGVTQQTKTHSHIASLFGVRKVIVAINKMDLVEYDQNIFNKIKDEYLEFANSLSFDEIEFVPISALHGKNIVKNDNFIGWYKGNSIIENLISDTQKKPKLGSARVQVQNIIKHENNRYYQGLLTGLDLSLGEEVIAYPSLQKSKITKIIHSTKEVKKAKHLNSISITLDNEIDLDRGGFLAPVNEVAQFQNSFSANIIWFNSQDFDALKKQELIIKINHNYLRCQIETNKSLSKISLNDLVKVSINLSEKTAFDDFSQNKYTGSFLLIDPNDNNTLACGIIENSSSRQGKNTFLKSLINKISIK